MKLYLIEYQVYDEYSPTKWETKKDRIHAHTKEMAVYDLKVVEGYSDGDIKIISVKEIEE